MTPEELKFYRNNFQGFINEIGFRLTDVREGYAAGELTLTDFHRNPIGSTHGGVMFSMADTTGGAAAGSYGQACTTVSGNINYLSPAMNCKKLISEAREVKVGKRMAVFDVMIRNEFGTDIAQATMRYYYLGPMEEYFDMTAVDEPDTGSSAVQSETEK